MYKAEQADIDKWKKKHGDVFCITSGDEQFACYLRKPTRQEMGYASKLATSNPLAFNEAIVKACWLAGDEEMRTDDAYYWGLCSAMSGIVEVKDAELKKL